MCDSSLALALAGGVAIAEGGALYEVAFVRVPQEAAGRASTGSLGVARIRFVVIDKVDEVASDAFLALASISPPLFCC